MKPQKKRPLTAIAFTLMLTISALLAATLYANAVTYSTTGFIVAYPDPVGVGQQMTVVAWVGQYPPRLIINGARTIGGDMWLGITITITKPDNTVDTMGPYESDYMGVVTLRYTPTQTGTYKFQMAFPGQTFPPEKEGNTYLGTESGIAEVTVQEEPIQELSDGVLPTGYWQRPVNDMNRAWSPIAGNWLLNGYDYASRSFDGGSAFNPYTTAPSTAHIVWTRPLESGGLMGAPYGSDPYYTGSSYQLKMTPPVIMNGRLYYNTIGNPLRSRPTVPTGFSCIDIRTGELVYEHEDMESETLPYLNIANEPEYGYRYPGIMLGQILMFNSVNQYGGYTYLWAISTRGSNRTMDMYEAFTGEHWLRFVNVTAGTWVINEGIPGESGGELLDYVYDPRNGWFAMWNSTRAIQRESPTNLGGPEYEPNRDLLTVGAWYWAPPYNATLNWEYGIEWNATIPLKPGARIMAGPWFTEGVNVIIASRTFPPADDSTTGWQTYEHIAYDAKTGQQLWAQNRTNLGQQSRGGHITPQNSEVYVMRCAETKQWIAYSVTTGNQLWISDPDESDWAYYGGSENAAYGMFYGALIDGQVRAFDIQTGELKWQWSTGSSGFETPYSDYPIYGGTVIADHKLFVNEGTHGNGAGLWRGNTMAVLDTDTGDLLWRVAGWFDGATLAIADGYVIAHNYYDNQIYSFGKGLTGVTVSAPDVATTMGTPIIIKGTVTDQGPGQTCLGIPAAGTAAIADEDMSAWMEYLYMQQPAPTDAKGVDVLIDVIDSNGNYRNIGTATSDATGLYSFTWEPDIPGDYTVIATFAGSEAYYPSCSETAFTVVEPTVTPAPTPAPAGMTDTYVLGFGIGMIITIIVAAIAIILVLRKR